MCQFFSLVSDGEGKVYYFDWGLRKQCLSGKLKYEPDSHTSIADYFGFKGKAEDTLNKYEYNPLLKRFQIDQLNTKDDSKCVKKLCQKLDFKKIVPQLRIRPIINPLEVSEVKRITPKDIKLLKAWDSVGDSVGASVWNSVRASVRASVWASVGASVWDSVRASVWASVGASVGDSVGASVRAYTGSFFNLSEWQMNGKKTRKYPFRPCVDLWEKGLVPSFDGKTWRLHTGKEAKIIYELDKQKI